MVSREQTKRLRSLRRRKGRVEHGLFLAEGPHLVRELIESPLTPVLLVYTPEAAAGEQEAELIRDWRLRGAPCEEADEREMQRISDTVTPQGVLAVGRVHEWGWQDLDGPRILVLDGVQDPGNVGALIRVAEALGMDGIVFLPGTADPWSPKVVRASAGSLFRVPFASAGWPETRDRLRSSGRTLWAAAGGGTPYRGGEPAPERLALVLGNEGAGVSPATRADCDAVISIELAGGVESLNVAVAGALLMDRISWSGCESG